MSGRQKADTQQMNLKPFLLMSVQGPEVGAFTRAFVKIRTRLDQPEYSGCKKQECYESDQWWFYAMATSLFFQLRLSTGIQEQGKLSDLLT